MAVLTSGPVNFDPDPFLDRSRSFLGEREIPMDDLKRALRDPRVAHVIARMEGEREAEPTLTAVEDVQGKIRFKVSELSKESPLGKSMDPGDFGQKNYLAKLMHGRGASFSKVITLTRVGEHRPDGYRDLNGEPVWAWEPRPMTLAEYHGISGRGVDMDISSTSYLLPPWGQDFRDRAPWLRDGVYFGERGQVIHITARGKRVLWRPEDEQSRDPDPNFDEEPYEGKLRRYVKGSPKRGVRYAFEFMVERSN